MSEPLRQVADNAVITGLDFSTGAVKGLAFDLSGTVVAEVSIGLRGGVGRLVIDYAQSAGGDPAKPWAPIFGTVAVGLLAAGAVALIGLALGRFRRSEVPA